MEDIKVHIVHYIILFIILAFGFLAFFYFSFDKNAQRIIIGALSLSYLSWGIIHHFLEKNLNWKIVVEYTLIALLTFVLIGGLL